MILSSIADMPSAEECAVIINASAKLPTTLALLSALKYAEMPVLVIDCQSADRSFEYFCEVMEKFDFNLLSRPLDSHGATLDWIFEHIPAKKVLLMDSDAELLGPEIMGIARQFIDDEMTFGCGFMVGPSVLPEGHPPNGYYEERFWLPFAMLKTSLVREAIRDGCSFSAKTFFNDCAMSQFLSRMMRIRYRFPILGRLRISWLDHFRRSFHGHKPSYVVFDTGAEVHQHLKYEKEYLFVGFPAHFSERYVRHLGGVTRLLLRPELKQRADTRLDASLDSVHDEILKRLKERYGFSPAVSS